MTDRELMQQALEALEIECKGYADKVTRNRPLIAALRERLAQLETRPATREEKIVRSGIYERAEEAYAAAKKRKWVGLTEQDFSAINQSSLTKLQAATCAESILKEKNGQ